MTKYFHVTEGSIDDGPRPIPSAWKNVSGLNNATLAELKSYGWLPQVPVNEDAVYNKATHKLTGPVNVVGTDDVTSTWTVVAKTQGEIDADAALEDAALDAAIDLLLGGIDGRVSFAVFNDAQTQGQQLSLPDFKLWIKANA